MKFSLKIIESTQDNSLSNYISVVVLPLEGLVQVALRKAPVIAPFEELFKVGIMRGSHRQILIVLWKVPLKNIFP